MRIRTFGVHTMPLDVVYSTVPYVQDGHDDPWTAQTPREHPPMLPSPDDTAEAADKAEMKSGLITTEADDSDGAGI